MTSFDTAPEARRVQLAVLRRKGRAERVRIAAAMSEEARELTMIGIRARHPAWTEEQVRRELLTRLYGAELVERAWGPANGP